MCAKNRTIIIWWSISQYIIYITAGIYLLSKDYEKSKSIYKEIILSKNKFYSVLALNNIIENALEKDNEEIQPLLDEITILREQNLQLNQQLLEERINAAENP